MLWIPFIIWPFLNKLIIYNTSYTNPKIINNFLSGIHSVGFVMFNGLYMLTDQPYLLHTCLIFSGSYFIWDGYYSFIKFDKPNYLWIIHHVASLVLLNHIYYLLQYSTYPLLLYLFTIAEISNFPMYCIYHRLQTLELTNITAYKICQLVWFSYLRVWIYSHYIFDFFNLDTPFINCLVYMFYFMGIHWAGGQVAGIYRALKCKPSYIQKKDD
jgi:hypothetical protein